MISVVKNRSTTSTPIDADEAKAISEMPESNGLWEESTTDTSATVMSEISNGSLETITLPPSMTNDSANILAKATTNDDSNGALNEPDASKNLTSDDTKSGSTMYVWTPTTPRWKGKKKH